MLHLGETPKMDGETDPVNDRAEPITFKIYLGDKGAAKPQTTLSISEGDDTMTQDDSRCVTVDE